jgi:hypothetical protein
MQNRSFIVGSLLLASAVAVGPVVDAQTTQHTQGPAARCFTPVTTTGVYFLVTAGGATDRILRAEPRATPQRVTHSIPHSQMHVTAIARVRVPGPEPNIDGELFSRLEAPPVQPPAIHSLKVRHTQRHADVLIHSAIGSTGCRLRLR